MTSRWLTALQTTRLPLTKTRSKADTRTCCSQLLPTRAPCSKFMKTWCTCRSFIPTQTCSACSLRMQASAPKKSRFLTRLFWKPLPSTMSLSISWPCLLRTRDWSTSKTLVTSTRSSTNSSISKRKSQSSHPSNSVRLSNSKWSAHWNKTHKTQARNSRLSTRWTKTSRAACRCTRRVSSWICPSPRAWLVSTKKSTSSRFD